MGKGQITANLSACIENLLHKQLRKYTPNGERACDRPTEQEKTTRKKEPELILHNERNKSKLHLLIVPSL